MMMSIDKLVLPKSIRSNVSTKILEAEIAKNGIITPIRITLIQNQTDRYIVRDGSLRVRAAKKLQIKEVPVVIIDRPEPLGA